MPLTAPTGPPPGFTVLERTGTDDATTFTIRVDDDCPHCADHFPGEPIVPAIALLCLVTGLARPGAANALGAVDALRLRGAVRPGDELSIRVSTVTSDKRSFRILRREELVTEGSLRFDGDAH